MQILIFWASYLYFPFAVVCLYLFFKSRGVKLWLAVFAFIATSVLAYARFVEPRILTVHAQTILTQGARDDSPSIRLALFSDTHFGIFKNAMPMSRIVAAVNRQRPDAVFIAGDFLYHLPAGNIPDALAALGDLEAPIYAVLGNHDVGYPGPVYTPELYSALQALGVTLVENRALAVNLAGQDILIGGVSDLWQRRQDYTFATTLPDKPLILLTHNPDTALAIPANVPYALMLAGHTHGGQVRLPGMLRRVIPTQYPFDKELHAVPINGGERLVYVTSGTGMVGLPLRFNMAPRIDVLTVHLPARD